MSWMNRGTPLLAAIVAVVRDHRARVLAHNAIRSTSERIHARSLAALDRGFAATARDLNGRALIYSHPVYQYFAARYGLPGLSLHWEPDVMPSEDEWSSLVHNALDNTLFVWEGEPDSAIADRLAALGIAQLTLDPGANEQGDWLALQQRNLDRLKALTEQP